MDPQKVRDLAQQNAITRAVGKAPEKGHIWAFNDQGALYQKKVKESDDKGTLPTAQLEFNLQNLKKSADVIVGRQDPTTGKYTGGAGTLGSMAAQFKPFGVNIGSYVNSGTAEAYEAVRHAAMTVTYALSGKQIGQKEQQTILEMFMPTATESTEMKAFKIDALHGLYERLLEAKKAGITDKARAKLFDTELEKAARRMQELRAAEGQAPAQGGGGGGRQGWGIEKIQ
jgi:hypothetical protein